MQIKCGSSFLCIYYCSNLYLAKQTFLQEQVHQKMLFSEQLIFDCNVIFTVTLSVYRLVIIPTTTKVFRLELPRGCTENLSINTMNKKLHQICFFRGPLNRTIYQKIKKSQFLGCLIKMYISVLNFNTEPD